MKRFFLFFVAFCLSFPLLHAQDLGKAEMECFYRLTFLNDTVKNLSKEDFTVLRFNKEHSLFYSKDSYYLDSLLCSDQQEAVSRQMFAEISSPTKTYKRGTFTYTIHKDFKNQELIFMDDIVKEYYKYVEKIHDFDWQITDAQKKIWDYTCQKAVCTFRGRTYEAWFTSEIPVQNGPWKFHGLPGLIMEVYDTQKHYVFEFVGIKKSDANITLLPYQYTLTSRDTYMKAYKKYIKDPLAALGTLREKMGIKVVRKSNGLDKKLKAKTIHYDLMELN